MEDLPGAGSGSEQRVVPELADVAVGWRMWPVGWRPACGSEAARYARSPASSDPFRHGDAIGDLMGALPPTSWASASRSRPDVEASTPADSLNRARSPHLPGTARPRACLRL